MLVEVPTKQDREKLACWTSEVASGMLTLDGWQGMEWWERLENKIEVGHDLSSKSAWQGWAG